MNPVQISRRAATRSLAWSVPAVAVAAAAPAFAVSTTPATSLVMSHRVVSADKIEVSVANLGSSEADVQVEVPLRLPGGSRHAWIAAGPEWGIGGAGSVAVVSTRMAAGTTRSFETDWVLATGLTRDDVVLTLRDGGTAVQTLSLTLPFA